MLASRNHGIWRNDPLLPLELQPPGWAGEEAHRLVREAHDLLAKMSIEVYAGLAV